jgi:hypothetical protein
MKYRSDIQAAASDPVQLEELYHRSRQANDEGEFRADLQELYEQSPDNLLYSAWRTRFSYAEKAKPRRATHWGWAVMVGVITGLILWAISDPGLTYLNDIPYLALLWAPIVTIPVLIFLAVISRRNYTYTAIASLGLVIASVYILLIAPGLSRFRTDYLILMAIQLPLLCWISLGIGVMSFRSGTVNRFAFLTKSIEVMIAAGVYLIFGMVFGLITIGMFQALNVTPPDILMRLAMLGGFGLIPVMAVVTMYDPHVSPAEQDFSQGLSKFVFTMVRLLLPLTLVVLVIYIFVIPFNFMAPFENRDLLIIYNVMQFAIIGLLVGATPLRVEDLSPKVQTWLRRGIIAVAILALVISLYALSAVVYRTFMAELTLNRTTIIGWNLINLVILGALIVTQLRKGTAGWEARLHEVFSKATGAYLVWSVLLVLLLPLIFR